MSYSHLTVEERIQKASEYAVILTADERPDFDIIKELKDTFGLTDEQAAKAYGLMRKNYKSAFNSTINSKIQNGWIWLSIWTVIGIAYAFIAGETGWPFLVIAILFGISAMQMLSNVATWYREKSGATPKIPSLIGEQENRSGKKVNQSNPMGVPLFFLFLLIITFFAFYQKKRTVKLNEIIRINRLIIDRDVEKKRTRGRHANDYLQFTFKGYDHAFKFNDMMYNYGKKKISAVDFAPGDTISIEIETKEWQEIQDGYANHTIYILNISQQDSWIIDQQERNKKVNKENRNTFLGFLAAFVISCIATFLWVIYRRKKADKHSVLQ